MFFTTSYKFDKRTIKILEDLKHSLGLPNTPAVLKRAITLLKVAADAREKGQAIYIRKARGEYEEIVLTENNNV